MVIKTWRYHNVVRYIVCVMGQPLSITIVGIISKTTEVHPMHGIVVLQCCFSWTHIPHLLLNREVGGRDGLTIISLVPRLSRGRRKRAWYTLFAHALNIPAFRYFRNPLGYSPYISCSLRHRTSKPQTISCYLS